MMIRTHLVRAMGLLAVATGLVACGSGGKADTGTTTTSSRSAASTTSSTSATTASSTSTTTSGATTSVAVFFARDQKVGAARRSVVAASPARGALEALVGGPDATERAAGLSSAIPAGTAVRGVSIAGGTATADFSNGFTSGGGSLSMQLRVAQVVYTLTQFPTVRNVRFEVDGAALSSLGGEGVMLGTPQTRADWESVTPAILLESPLPGDTLSSPFHVKGTADTFEATYMVTLIDSSGTKVYEHYGMATSGTGTRGTFDQEISFSGAASGNATLKLWERSAKDGSAINVVSIPVRL